MLQLLLHIIEGRLYWYVEPCNLRKVNFSSDLF